MPISGELIAAKKKAHKWVNVEKGIWGVGVGAGVDKIVIYLTQEARDAFKETEIDGFALDFDICPRGPELHASPFAAL
jgi:hypothetical protein